MLRWQSLTLLVALGTAGAAVSAYMAASRASAEDGAETVRVGIIHSLTGTMAVSEKSVLDATLLAIEEINRAGGVLGRLVEPIVVDGRSDPERFAEAAETLLGDGRVAAIFGAWTSASRKQLEPVVERHRSLLFYPVQYEGVEASRHIVYTGAVPNQQLLPAVDWSLRELGPRVFLVGSDYIFPRIANAVMRDAIERGGGEVVGEIYLPLRAAADVTPAIEAIRHAHPDVVLNTINGSVNEVFFDALRAAGITPQVVPTLSFSLSEDQLRTIGAYASMVGDYAAWTYFQSLEDAPNQRFVEGFKARFGESRVVGDPMRAAWIAVNLWARGVARAGTTEASAVREALAGVELEAPGGRVRFDSATGHLALVARIGRVRADGQFAVIWSSPEPIPPRPYPESRSREAWERLVESYRQAWGGWVKPEGAS